MSHLRWLLVAAMVGAITLGVAPAHADPITPLTAAEVEYLAQLHRLLPLGHDPSQFHGDGELLAQGRLVCQFAAVDQIGYQATNISPVISQLALVYLCPGEQ